MLCCTPMLVLLPAVAPGQARKAHVFHGTVQRVDVGARTVTVDGENVEGWMAAMSVTYHVDKADVLSRVKPGDRITATVYDGNFTTLYGVQVADQVVSPADLPPLS
jgi:protein SCO1/2